VRPGITTHAFPRSALHGLRWYELDPSGWLILAMAKPRPSPGISCLIDREQQRAKFARTPAPPVAAHGAGV